MHFVLASLMVALTADVAIHETDRIRPYENNPRYWQYKGKPVLLLGGSDEDNLFNHPALLTKNLDILKQTGGNYIRSTLSCRDKGNVWPFLKKDGKFHLQEFNPEFFRRLAFACQEADAAAHAVNGST